MTVEKKIQEATEHFTQAITNALREQLLEAFEGFGAAHVAAPKTNGAAPKVHMAKGAPVVERAKPKKGKRLARRSAGDIQAALRMVEGLLKKKPAGLRAEQIRAELGFEPKEMPRILKQGLVGRSLKILSGSKRATTYGLGSKAKR